MADPGGEISSESDGCDFRGVGCGQRLENCQSVSRVVTHTAMNPGHHLLPHGIPQRNSAAKIISREVAKKNRKMRPIMATRAPIMVLRYPKRSARYCPGQWDVLQTEYEYTHSVHDETQHAADIGAVAQASLPPGRNLLCAVGTCRPEGVDELGESIKVTQ